MSFGDRLYRNLTKLYKKVPDSLLHALIYAIGSLLDTFFVVFKGSALAQGSVFTAEGTWLDFWGYIFSARRMQNEHDGTYRQRMISSILLGSCTKEAILSAVRPYSKVEPVLTEYKGNVVEGATYTIVDFTTDIPEAFIMSLEYRMEDTSLSSFYIDNSFLDYNTNLLSSGVSQLSNNAITAIIRSVKLAGIKVILKPI